MPLNETIAAALDIGPNPYGPGAGPALPPEPVDDPVSEASLLAAVKDIARFYGWQFYHTHDSRRSEPGFPDLVLWHSGQHRIIFAELKTMTGALTPTQRETLNELTNAGADCGIEVCVWRPDGLRSPDRYIYQALRFQ